MKLVNNIKIVEPKLVIEKSYVEEGKSWSEQT